MKKRQIIWIHIAVWALLLISDIFTKYSFGIFSSYKNEPKSFHLLARHIIIQSTYLIIPITCFYCAYLFVAPQLFVCKSYLKAALFFLFTILSAAFLRYSIEYFFFLPILGFDNYNGHPWPVSDFISNVFFYYFPKYFMYGLMYFFAENWYKTKLLHQELQKEKSISELAFLRSQLNPHFLFNTLNDIYSLTYQKSDQAPESLLKLSELLRYMLRESNEDFMPLWQETQYLQTLVKLHQISAKGNAFIHFKVQGNVDDYKVASLLFVSFVENAFKHGVINDPLNPVLIEIVVDNEILTFSAINKKNNAQKDKMRGIGLNNVMRRLELMYPGNHKLDIIDEHEHYSVNLILQIKR